MSNALKTFGTKDLFKDSRDKVSEIPMMQFQSFVEFQKRAWFMSRHLSSY